MMSDKKREFLANIEKSDGKWLVDANFRRANRKWLRKSQSIALRILDVLDERGMQQKNLAKVMGVSPQQISKIVKGKQNLTLETIAKLEAVLDIQLIEVAKHQMIMDVEKIDVATNIRKRKEPKVVAHIDLGRIYNQNWIPSDDETKYQQTA